MGSAGGKSGGAPALAAGLKLCNVRLIAQRQTDVIKTFKQTPPSVVVNLEGYREQAYPFHSVNTIDHYFDTSIARSLGPAGFAKVSRIRLVAKR